MLKVKNKQKKWRRMKNILSDLFIPFYRILYFLCSVGNKWWVIKKTLSWRKDALKPIFGGNVKMIIDTCIQTKINKLDSYFTNLIELIWKNTAANFDCLNFSFWRILKIFYFACLTKFYTDSNFFSSKSFHFPSFKITNSSFIDFQN